MGVHVFRGWGISTIDQISSLLADVRAGRQDLKHTPAGLVYHPAVGLDLYGPVGAVLGALDSIKLRLSAANANDFKVMVMLNMVLAIIVDVYAEVSRFFKFRINNPRRSLHTNKLLCFAAGRCVDSKVKLCQSFSTATISAWGEETCTM